VFQVQRRCALLLHLLTKIDHTGRCRRFCRRRRIADGGSIVVGIGVAGKQVRPTAAAATY
jgi:hypothetical protein